MLGQEPEAIGGKPSANLGMEHRFAIAASIESPAGKILFGLRAPNLAEYSGAWSLPSSAVSEADYDVICRTERVPAPVSEALAKKCFSNRVQLDL